MPGAKEEFMQKLDTFFIKNIPKMEQFYKDILIPPMVGTVTEDLPVLPADVNDTVYGNALSHIWSVIFQSKKVTAQIDKEYTDNPEVHSVRTKLSLNSNLWASSHPPICRNFTT